MEKTTLIKHINQGLSQRKIACVLGVSQATVRYWLKKYNLSTKTNLGYECKHCGETDEDKFVNKGGGRKSRSCCKSCHSKYTIDRFRSYRAEAIVYKGGKCICCGYDKCTWSLGFHHRDPNQKDPNWRLMRNWKFDRVKSELDKCDLVCSNCHGEIHYKMGM